MNGEREKEKSYWKRKEKKRVPLGGTLHAVWMLSPGLRSLMSLGGREGGREREREGGREGEEEG